jgi:hypothetical protein
MGVGDATIRVQPLDGVWQPLGAGEGRLLEPQGLGFSHNDHGPDTASFNLPRRTGLPYRDLQVWTPAEILVGGAVCWEGRIRAAPEQQGGQDSIGIEGAGWQYHPDDDVYWKRYVETDLTRFKDQRSMLTSDLTVYSAGGDVSAAEDGAPLLTWPKNVVVPANACVGVTIDMGPGQDIAWASVTFAHSAAASSASVSAYVRAHTNESEAGSRIAGVAEVDLLAAQVLTTTASPFTTSGTLGATSGGTRRYLTVLLTWTTGGTITADTWLKITSIRLAVSSAYSTQLLASDIVKDALAYAPLLSQSTSQIATTSFPIPAYSPDGYRTPHQAFDDANAFHDYQWRVRQNRVLQYRARPSAPMYALGSWSDAAFNYASAGSGEDIYSDAIAQGTGPDGTQLAVRRVNTPASYAQDRASGQGAVNPSFTVDTSNWAVTLGTITRTTGTFNTGPAAGALANTAAQSKPVLTVVIGTGFVVGQTYRVRVFINLTTANTSNLDLAVLDASNAVIGSLAAAQNTDATTGNTTSIQNAWGERHIVFTATTTAATLQFSPTASTPASSLTLITVDDVITERAVPTLVNRRGFRRAKIVDVGMPITTAVLQQLGDAYLLNHHTTPFSGSLRVTGERDVRYLLGHAGAKPELLGWDVGELLLFLHLIDPDTGAVGRAGRVTACSYDHASRSATLDIDNSRSNFEALQARLGALS